MLQHHITLNSLAASSNSRVENDIRKHGLYYEPPVALSKLVNNLNMSGVQRIPLLSNVNDVPPYMYVVRTVVSIIAFIVISRLPSALAISNALIGHSHRHASPDSR